MADEDEVSIIIGTQKLSGWLGVRVRRGIERFPSDFSLTATERYPTDLSEIDIQPSAPCKVMLGDDLVVSGYVDEYRIQEDAHSHAIAVNGRSKCSDLVDCSAMFQTVQLNNLTIGNLANKLIAPFGITVSLPDGDSSSSGEILSPNGIESGVVPQITIIVTETPYEVIERVARGFAKLVFDDTGGNLVIASVGDAQMASGFQSGVNVQSASVTYSMVDRVTEIAAILQTTAVLTNDVTTVPIPYVANAQATDATLQTRADGQPRYRPLLILSESDQFPLIPQRVKWEMARRIGRSQAVTVVCDSWRDSAGTLWAPNSTAMVNLPALKLNARWLITEVTFLRDADGIRAEVTLMPPQAFQPEPTLLQPYFWQIGQSGVPGGAL